MGALKRHRAKRDLYLIQLMTLKQNSMVEIIERFMAGLSHGIESGLSV